MSTSTKRKFIDLTSGSPLPTQPNKKFKSSNPEKCIEVITEDCAESNQLPELEKDEQSINTDTASDDSNHVNHSNNNRDVITDNSSFEINQNVHLYRDDILHSAKIVEKQENNGNILYLIHYSQLSSVHDEWVPSHRIIPINTNTQTNSTMKRIYNEKLLNIVPSPAKSFPFELDPFQFEAIKSMETQNANLLITAHTSAGKTVIAEYAIAKALQNNQRVIYTSPIKALSNQKYREFTDKFGNNNIGLITGDVTKRKTASILVMTTEILRNMLYKGGTELREVQYVIFDEVHYMRDIERGVVWEESIILLNKSITLIFLSATLSNSDDFALWITDLKDKECRVIGTEVRPIVLEHYVLPTDSDGLYLVANSSMKGEFICDNFESAQGTKDLEKTYKQIHERKKRSKLKITQLQLLLFMLYKNDWCPAIVFAFSKREVEGHALALNDAINFCNEEESDMIEDVFNNAIDSLSDIDKSLPAVQSLLPLLKKGIGVHHSGILPILKEVTEILFQEGMIKVLFATETFAMGVNMPAKCVVFSAIEKFDGKETRVLSSSEYIQMSGRAGRRGIDDRGIVIMMLNESITKDQCKELMCGKAGALTSSFRLTYNMLLNISKNIRTNKKEEFSYQTVIEKSFYRFLMTQRIPQIEKRMKELRDLLNEFESDCEFEDQKIYFDLYELREKIMDKALRIMSSGNILNKYLEYGRIVFVQVNDCKKDEKKVWGYGVVLGYCKRYQPDTHFADILIPSQIMQNDDDEPQPIMDDNIDLTKPIKFKSLTKENRHKYGLNIVRFSTNCIIRISSVRITKLPKRITDSRDYFDIYYELNAVYKHFVDKIPELDVFKDMNILSFYKETNKISLKQEFEDKLPKLKERMNETVYFKNKFKDLSNYSETERALYLLYKEYKKSKVEYNKLSCKISSYNVGQFANELKCKCRVLKKLQYLNDENILTSKGIAASYLEINHEILITELMFDNFFDKLSSQEICSVLSVFVMDKPNKNGNQYKGNNRNKLKFAVPLIVHESFESILNKARQILSIKKECGLTEFELFNNEDDYIASFNPDLIIPMFQWVNGVDFVEVNKLTPLFEGSLIRLIKRLRDIINQLVDAAKAIGNQELSNKFADCIEKIQRGIVFAASLYVDDLDDEEEEEEEEEEDVKNNVDIDDDGETESESMDDEANETINEIFGDNDKK